MFYISLYRQLASFITSTPTRESLLPPMWRAHISWRTVSCQTSCPAAGCPFICCCRQNITGKSFVSGPFFVYSVSGVLCLTNFPCILAPELSEETFPTILLITKLMKVMSIYTSVTLILNNREASVVKACISLSFEMISSLCLFLCAVSSPKSTIQHLT